MCGNRKPSPPPRNTTYLWKEKNCPLGHQGLQQWKIPQPWHCRDKRNGKMNSSMVDPKAQRESKVIKAPLFWIISGLSKESQGPSFVPSKVTSNGAYLNAPALGFINFSYSCSRIVSKIKCTEGFSQSKKNPSVKWLIKCRVRRTYREEVTWGFYGQFLDQSFCCSQLLISIQYLRGNKWYIYPKDELKF